MQVLPRFRLTDIAQCYPLSCSTTYIIIALAACWVRLDGAFLALGSLLSCSKAISLRHTQETEARARQLLLGSMGHKYSQGYRDELQHFSSWWAEPSPRVGHGSHCLRCLKIHWIKTGKWTDGNGVWSCHISLQCPWFMWTQYRTVSCSW